MTGLLKAIIFINECWDLILFLSSDIYHNVEDINWKYDNIKKHIMERIK
jgi:hypothetical protein